MSEIAPATVQPRKHPVVGVGISMTSYSEVAQVCARWIADRRAAAPGALRAARYICVTSVHGIVSAVLNRSLRPVFNGADIATPDGMPVVWALRSFGARQQQRVYGPDLMLALCAQAAACGHRVFLYGGREEMLAALCERLKEKMPALQIVGACSPPFRPLTSEEDAQIVSRILDLETDLLFVGLSTPKQDRWMLAHRDKLPGLVMVGVGAAFDFHAGRVSQAPTWMQRTGLEWLFRLKEEPSRLWKRYLLVTPLFLPLWGLQLLGFLKYKEEPVRL
jgi:N-acetylglucosaminyldiphosphoundecaprenol N-acetyl-beta-D-mannosaminyltransferase